MSVIVYRHGEELRIICVYCNGKYETIALSQVGLREGVDDAISQAPTTGEHRIYFKDFNRDEVQAFQATMAFGKGPPPPPPPNSATVVGPVPWRGGGGGSKGPGSGRGATSGTGAPGDRSPILLALREGEREADRTHALEVRHTSDILDPAKGDVEAKGIKAVSDYVSQKVDWSAAKINPIQDAAISLNETQFELVVPTPSLAQENLTAFALKVKWKRTRLPPDEQRVASTLANENSKFVGSLRDGIHRLIDRLYTLRFEHNAISEVSVQFRYQTYDAVITMELPSELKRAASLP